MWPEKQNNPVKRGCMAFDAKDIERLKAAIPDHHQPQADAAGSLASVFSSVDPRSGSTALQGSGLTELDRYNYGSAYVDNPDQGSPSFLLNGSQLTARQAKQQAQHNREQAEERSFVDRVLAALDARLAALDARLFEIDNRLEAIRLRREAIGTEMEALDELEALKRSGKLDPNNPHHAELLRAAGITADEAMGDDFAATVTRRRQALNDEDDALEGETNARLLERGEVQALRNEAWAAKQDIENADSEEARVRAERRASSLLGVHELAGAAYETQDKQARNIAANAVGKNEVVAVRRDSLAYNNAAAASDSDAIAGAKVRGFELDEEMPGNNSPALPKPK